jgi:uncharacterized membrane protein
MIFGGLIELVLIVVAIAALMLANGFSERLRRVEERLETITSELSWLRIDRGTRSQGLGAATSTAVGQVDAPVAEPKQKPEQDKATRTPAEPLQSSVPASAIVKTDTPNFDRPSPPKSESFEERLGTQWAVWAGGAALALGGLFLVRYSIDAGLLGPGVRVVMGALLALGLLATGETLRRGERQIPIDGLPHAHIPSILTAAGTIVAFGTIYAAHALYGFIGPALAFLLLGGVGVATMLAAAVHGPALAGLGLAGSFATPLLVQSSDPSYWSLTLYLAVIAATAYILALMRQWLWLALSAVAGVVFWGVTMIARAGLPGGTMSVTDAAAAHALLQLALCAGLIAYQPHVKVRDEAAHPDRVASMALAALAVLVSAFLAATPFTYWGWIPSAGLAIACLSATGWMSAPAASALGLAGIVALSATLVWPGLDLPPDQSLLMPYAARVLRLPENVSSYLAFAALASLGPAAVAIVRMWRGSLLPEWTTGFYALAATVPPLLALIISYLRITQFDISIPFALGGAALACAYGAAADRFDKADDAYSVPAYNLAAGALAAAAIAALAFALVVSLARGYLTVALALAALGTAYIASLRDIHLLRHAVTALGVMVLARIAWDPRIMGADVGTLPILNWLLIGYGVPAVAFAMSARLLGPHNPNDLSVRICDALSIIFVGLLAFFQIRHWTNGGDVFYGGTGHVEAGLMTFVSIGLSYALAKLQLGKGNTVFEVASIAFGAFSIGFATVGLLGVANPYFTNEAIGGRALFSSLLVGYLLPGLAALFVARHARSLRPECFTRAAGILAVALIFFYVTLEVRHAFLGERISKWLGTSDAESWAYSFAWLLLGILFLGYGLLRGSLEARMASAILVVLAALKVTLFDLAGIGGFWRAASFICLGAVLIGIGLVYQKFVFAKPPAPAVPDAT